MVDEPFYARDLAYVHDAGFGDFARDAAPALLKRLQRRQIGSGLVVDLGCGSGIWARELTDAGYDVVGVDISEDLLDIARKRAPTAKFVHASLLDAKLPQCRAVTAMGEIVSYAADPRAGRDGLTRLFKKVHRALEPGGVFVFDVAEPGYLTGRPRRDWHEGPGWTVCVNVTEDSAAHTVRREIVTYREAGKSWRRTDEVHHLNLFDRKEVAKELAATGFRAEVLPGYGRMFRTRRGHVAIEATKR